LKAIRSGLLLMRFVMTIGIINIIGCTGKTSDNDPSAQPGSSSSTDTAGAIANVYSNDTGI
jgi:hypothetical protein